MGARTDSTIERRGALLENARDQAWGERPPPEGPRGLAIVIVTYNSKRFLHSLLSPLIGMNVVVVDNASKDGTPDVIRVGYPWVTLLRMERNLGLAAGFNVGWRHTAEPYVLLLNPDVMVNPD